MYIVPVVSAPVKAPALRQIWMFLERNGNHLIQLDPSTSIEDFLEVNDLKAAGTPILLQGGNVAIVPIDPVACDLHTFYSWREVTPGETPSKEVWRSFLWVSNDTLANATNAVDPWGVNQLLQEIVLAEPNHTAHSILSAYLATATATATP